MGMYTEFHYNTQLKEDIPQDVLSILQFMLGEDERCPTLPKHPLFNTSRWDYMLRCDSCYFDADTHSTLRFDDSSNAYYLCIRCNLKNYDDEIEHFINWIHPYIDKFKGEFLGFYRYESNDQPTLIFA